MPLGISSLKGGSDSTTSEPEPPIPSLDDEWHKQFYAEGRYAHLTWRGIPLIKNPMDIPIFAEIIHEVMPRAIIETGTRSGGSALFYADMMTVGGVPNGRVITVEHTPIDGVPYDDRIKYVEGGSLADETTDEVHHFAWERRPRIVILDSDHGADHVYRELEAYSYLVTPGSYLIVEDTNIGGHPVEGVEPPQGGGPMFAVQRWLPDHPEFEPDPFRERFGVTWNPRGWLRRK